MISKRDWYDWKQSDVTKELVKVLTDRREMIKEGVVEEKFEGDLQKWIGQSQAIKDVLLFITEEWKEELDDH